MKASILSAAVLGMAACKGGTAERTASRVAMPAAAASRGSGTPDGPLPEVIALAAPTLAGTPAPGAKVGVRALATSRNGKFAVALLESGAVERLEIGTGAVTAAGAMKDATDVAMSDDGLALALAVDARGVVLDGRPLALPKTYLARRVAFAPGAGPLVVLAQEDIESSEDIQPVHLLAIDRVKRTVISDAKLGWGHADCQLFVAGSGDVAVAGCTSIAAVRLADGAHLAEIASGKELLSFAVAEPAPGMFATVGVTGQSSPRVTVQLPGEGAPRGFPADASCRLSPSARLVACFVEGELVLRDTSPAVALRARVAPAGVSAIAFAGEAYLVGALPDGRFAIFDVAAAARGAGAVAVPPGTPAITAKLPRASDAPSKPLPATTAVQVPGVAPEDKQIGDVVPSPDGTALAIATLDKVVVLTIATGAARTIARDGVATLAWSPDGTRLAIGETLMQTRLRIVPMTGDKTVKIAAERRDGALAWSAHGDQLATGGPTHGAVAVWSTATGEKLHDLTLPPAFAAWALDGLAFVPDGRLLAWARDAPLVAVDLASGQVTEVRGHTGGVRQALVAANGSVIVTVGYDGVIVVHDATTLAPNGSIRERDIESVVLAPDGSRLAFTTLTGNDTTVEVWRVADGTPIVRYVLPAFAVPSLAWGGATLFVHDLETIRAFTPR